MLKAGAEMVGSVFLLLATGLYGRHVILDAEGRLPRRQSKGSLPSSAPDAEEDQPQAAAGEEWTKIDSPHATPQPLWTRSPSAAPTTALPAGSAAATASAPAAPSQASQAPLSCKLTKAERKALRQRLEQERLKRQLQQRSGWTK
jgi:hypothetical protein